MADEKLTSSIERLREENNDRAARQEAAVVDNTQETKEGFKSLSQTVGELLAEFRGSRLDAEEARRENKGGGAQAPAPKPTAKAKEEDFDLPGFLLAMAATIGAVGGFLIGAVEGFIKTIRLVLRGALKVLTLGMDKKLGKVFANFKARFVQQITKIADTARDVFKTVVKPIVRAFDNIRDAFIAGTNGVKGMAVAANGSFRKLNFIERLFNNFGKGITAIRNFIMGSDYVKDVAKVADGVKDAGKGFSIFKKIGDTFSAIGKAVRSFGATVGKFFGIFRALGRVIFFPLTIIMSIFDAFTGFNEEMDKEGATLLDGIFGAIGGVFRGLIGMPLDLLKSAVGWIAGKLGFENFEKDLASFSFSEMIFNMFTAIPDLIRKGIDWVVDFYNNFDLAAAMDSFLESLRTLPARLLGFIPDMALKGISWVLEQLGMTEAADSLSDFSVTDTLQPIYDWIFGLPMRLVNGIMGIFNSQDPLGEIGNIGTALLEKMKGMVRGAIDMIPEFLVPDSVFEWLDAPVPPPPPKPKKLEADLGVQKKERPDTSMEALLADTSDFDKKLEDTSSFDKALEQAELEAPERSTTLTTESENVGRQTIERDPATQAAIDAETAAFLAEMDSEEGKARVAQEAADRSLKAAEMEETAARSKLERENRLAEMDRQATEDLLAQEDKIRAYLERDDISEDRRSQAEFKLAKIDRIRSERGANLSQMSTENEQAKTGGGQNVIMVDNSSQSNSSSNTTALMNQNMPTIDPLDRQLMPAFGRG